jgi:hypothetical protein
VATNCVGPQSGSIPNPSLWEGRPLRSGEGLDMAKRKMKAMPVATANC